MGYDIGIAGRLRRAGLNVVEVAGWQTRGSSTFNPRGFVWHHTAGPARGNAPSLTICTYGRAGLPGPLCNVFQARDNTIYVVAAGRANHAGTGGWKGLSGNSSVYGIEIENTGTGSEPWRLDQLDVAAKVAAALLGNPSMSCHHKEWTGRKVDMHTVSGDAMRAQTQKVMAPPPAPGPAPAPQDPEEDEVSYIKTTDTNEIWVVYGERIRRLTQTAFDQRQFIAGGKLAPKPMHSWALAKFAIDFQLLTDPPVK